MGNKKNQRNHRHEFVHKKPPEKYHQPLQSPRRQNIHMEGSRIINLHKLKHHINQLTIHSAQCRGTMTLHGETRYGLASILNTTCNKCNCNLSLETSSKVQGPKGYSRWEANLTAVWGQMCTGGGYANLKNTMCVSGIPMMDKKAFINTEQDIGEWWRLRLHDTMVDTGKETCRRKR